MTYTIACVKVRFANVRHCLIKFPLTKDAKTSSHGKALRKEILIAVDQYLCWTDTFVITPVLF